MLDSPCCCPTSPSALKEWAEDLDPRHGAACLFSGEQPVTPFPSQGRDQRGEGTACLEREGETGSVDPATMVVSDSPPGEGCAWRDAQGGKQTPTSFQTPLMDTV